MGNLLHNRSAWALFGVLGWVVSLGFSVDSAWGQAVGSTALPTITTSGSQFDNERLGSAQDALETMTTQGMNPDVVSPDSLQQLLNGGVQEMTSPQRLSGTLQIMLLMTVLSLAPALLLMTTSFVRIIVVLGLLRQALGTQTLPPSQVITSLALFLTLLVMTPTWNQVYQQAIAPYTAGEISDPEVALNRGIIPIKRFMSRQIDVAGNADDVWMFYSYLPESTQPENLPETYDDVPLQALLPAFLLSELKTAFLIGFQIFLPFLILDIVVSTVTASMGMMMLPPSMISLPFKLLLFVLVDGWTLVIGMLLESFSSAV